MILLEVFVVLLITWYAVFQIKRRRMYKLAEMFDGPLPVPVLGNALKCIMPLSEMPDALLKGIGYYKSSIRFWFGPFLIIYLTDPEHIRTVLNSSHAIDKPRYMYRLGAEITGEGLVGLPGDKWKRHRRLISHNFNKGSLENYFNTFVKFAKRLTDDLKINAGKKVFDVEKYVAKHTLNIAFEALLGFNCDKDNVSAAHDVPKLIKTLNLGIARRIGNILYYSDTIYNMSPEGKKFLAAKRKFDQLVHLIIEEWKNVISTKKREKTEEHLINASYKPRNFVEHMLLVSDEDGKFNSKELEEEAKTLIVTGYETVAYILGLTLIMLGMHQEIQELVYAEISKVLVSRREIQYQDLANFPYLERVIKETLRLFPVVVGIGRYNDREVKLDDEHIIPSNTSIIIGLLTLHRNPNIWHQPLKFDPDRFLPEEIAKRHPYSWLPFSSGPRNCIGYQFAMSVLKVMIAYLVMNYKITTPYKNVESIRMSTLLFSTGDSEVKISITAR